MKRIAIESKVFEVRRDGREVLFTKKGWKVVKSLSLGLDTARWFSRALEGSLKTGRKEFYTAHREGGRGFIAQWCVRTLVASTWLWWSTVGEAITASFLFLRIGMERGGETLRWCC